MDADITTTTAILERGDRAGAPLVIVPFEDQGPWPVHGDEIEAGLMELEAAVKAVNDANAALVDLMRRMLYRCDQGSPRDGDALAPVLRH